MVQLHRIRMNILQLDLNLLKILYVMLSTGSTSLTAKKLGLSASAVSHALTRLRDSLNDPLFRRVGNQQVPTLFAEKLKEKLVPLFASLNEELFGGASPDARIFRVVLPPALNVLLTPELARKGHEAEAVIECLTFERREWRDELIEKKLICSLQSVTIRNSPVSCITNVWEVLVWSWLTGRCCVIKWAGVPLWISMSWKILSIFIVIPGRSRPMNWTGSFSGPGYHVSCLLYVVTTAS